jgi:hypothetical protein
MRPTPVASILSTTALALMLSACQTASNAPNGIVLAALPQDNSVKNETLTNLIIPETFQTASATALFIRENVVDDLTFRVADAAGNLTGTRQTRQERKEFYNYGGDQPAGISSNVLITRNPRDATFNVVIEGQDKIAANVRYQDSAHRTLPATINGDRDGLFTVPDSANFEYYRTKDRVISDTTTITYDQILFFERPGTTTKYVTWAAFWDGRTIQSIASSDYVKTDKDTGLILEGGSRTVTSYEDKSQRTAAVFGINVKAKDVPKSGSASYAGSLFANTIYGGFKDTILGTSTTRVNFADNSMKFTYDGRYTSNGAGFSATGSGKIERPDIPNTALNPAAVQPFSSFRGTIDSVSIAGTPYRFESITTAPFTYQASSIEGGFFGPNVAEVGGAFRIVGGLPDQRLDILGAFTGKKN